MDNITSLIQTTTGISLAPLLGPNHHHRNDDRGLEFARSTVTPVGQAALASERARAASTVPPEIIQLIVNYLDKRDLIKVITLNWTWANIVAPKLWQEVHFTANANRVVFLITKSVAPSSKSLNNTEAAALSSTALSTTTNAADGPADMEHNQFAPPIVEERPAASTRRNSYPWPTLLPYHSMVHSLHVSLSSADMIHDLMDMIPCCSELRSFSIQSAIPTEDLLISGVIASACNDKVDPLNESRATSPPSTGHIHPSISSGSLASQASQASDSSSFPLPYTGRHQHSHTHSLSVDPYLLTTTPRAGLQETDDETIMASSTAQSGRLLGLLASSCPKLEKLWFSGFHPISVLGGPTDLRARPVKKMTSKERDLGHSTGCKPPVAGADPTILVPVPVVAKGNIVNAKMPPMPSVPNMNTATAISPVPGMNTAVASISPALGTNTAISTSTSNTTSTVSSITGQPYAIGQQEQHQQQHQHQQQQSRIRSLQFVNCTLPPQYLLTMIQHSLPNLTALHLTQCWQGKPLQGQFLESLARTCPGLREITLHATQSHRGSVTSASVLKMLEGLEDAETQRTTEEEALRGGGGGGGGGGGSGGGGAGGAGLSARLGSGSNSDNIVGTLAGFPLGAFGGAKHTAPSISSTAATVGSSSMSTSNSSSSSALVTLPSSESSSMDSTATDQQQHYHHQQPQNGIDAAQSNPTLSLSLDTSSRMASALEVISVWFTHSVLDQAITSELANRARHPRLKRVDFGSEDAFDIGEDCIQILQQQRPELTVCTWVGYSDTGDDRED
ncbi:hypothetical protein EDD11_004740 [Mortierella claussenii]|nr:hypothetical protein EDD11_004740 [Mortierella claussenii]